VRAGLFHRGFSFASGGAFRAKWRGRRHAKERERG